MKCNFTDYLEETSRRFPEKTAFLDSDVKVSFQDFRAFARRVATAVIRKGLFRKPIMVYLDKKVVTLEAIFGIIYSGNFYTPVDVHMPSARVKKIMDTLEPELIITEETYREKVTEISETVPILTLEELEEMVADEELVDRRREQIIDTDLLYVFFTSGSTGIPKGVMISHRAVMDFVEAVNERFAITEKERIGNQGAFYFDLSTLDIYCTVASGATLYIIPPKFYKFPVKLLQYIAEHKINMIYWVPSALVVTANLRALQIVDVSCLKKITFCGEVMPCKQLNIWKKYVPDAMYVNMYGPTETTCASTYYVVDREFEDGDSLPIGIPFRNTRVILLNEEGQEAGENEPGEICIAGSGLAYGYYKDEKRTKESFVTIGKGASKERIYKTGDLAKYNERGELIYLSRKDFQIKHMGHRIELGEIETALNSIPEVTECCCMYDEEKHKIVAFLEAGLEEDYVRERLSGLILDYMQPNQYYFLQKIPHNANGKIDRAKLKDML